MTKEYPGYLSSQLKVDLVARVNGYLRTSYLKAGSRVKKGDLIFVIEPDTYQDNVTQAEASVKTSKAQLEYARSNYERMKEAAKSGAVSQIQVIQAEATVSESEAAVKNAEAELNTARTNLSYCYIRAPFDGAVTRASYDIGNYINGAVQPVTLATLYKDDLMFANFNIEDNQFMKMMLEAARNDSTVKLPTEILVSIGKDGGNAYTGRLDYLSPNIDLSTGTLNVRANLDNPKHVLRAAYTSPSPCRMPSSRCGLGSRCLDRYRPIREVPLYRERLQCRTIPSYRGGPIGRRYASPSDRRYRPQRFLCHFRPA